MRYELTPILIYDVRAEGVAVRRLKILAKYFTLDKNQRFRAIFHSRRKLRGYDCFCWAIVYVQKRFLFIIIIFSIPNSEAELARKYAFLKYLPVLFLSKFNTTSMSISKLWIGYCSQIDLCYRKRLILIINCNYHSIHNLMSLYTACRKTIYEHFF